MIVWWDPDERHDVLTCVRTGRHLLSCGSHPLNHEACVLWCVCVSATGCAVPIGARITNALSKFRRKCSWTPCSVSLPRRCACTRPRLDRHRATYRRRGSETGVRDPLITSVEDVAIIATRENPELSPAREHLVEAQTLTPNTRGWGRSRQATECHFAV